MEKYTLNLDTNSVVMPVVRDGKNAGSIRICPDDTVFLGKFYALLPKLEKEREELAASLKDDDTEKTLEAMQSLWQRLRADIDEVFGKGVCDIAFGDTCSLTLAQQFFDGVANALGEARADKIDAYISPQAAVIK